MNTNSARKRSALIRFFCDNKKYTGWILLSFFIAIAGGTISIGFSDLIGEMVDKLIATANFDVVHMSIRLGLLAIAEILRSLLYSTVNASGNERMFEAMRLKVWDVLSHADMVNLENDFSSGDTLSRVNSDMSSLCENLTGQLPWLLRVVLSGLLSLIYCIYLNWKMAAVYMILLPVSIQLIKSISRPMKRFSLEKSQTIGEAMNIASDAIHGIISVKAFQIEEKMDQRYGAKCDAAAQKAVENEKVAIKLTAAKTLLSTLPMCALLFLALMLISQGEITVGVVIAFLTSCRNIDSAMRLSDSMASSIRRSEAMAERIYSLLDIQQETNGDITAPKQDEVAVCFKNVLFSYPGKEPILKKISFEIPVGKKVGIVGASGCGKSSILKLICGFYSPTSGEVVVQGISTRDWDKEALRKHLSIVTQDSYLFDGTMRENITGESSRCDYDRVNEAIENASLLDYVEQLPYGIDTRINELGASLSGGQRQRFAIARAFYKDASIVLLDEPTSALDQHTQLALNRAFEKLMHNRTAIVVSHQFCLLKELDWILYIEDGQIAEEGSVSDLIKSKGKFFNMMEKQACMEGWDEDE